MVLEDPTFVDQLIMFISALVVIQLRLLPFRKGVALNTPVIQFPELGTVPT